MKKLYRKDTYTKSEIPNRLRIVTYNLNGPDSEMLLVTRNKQYILPNGQILVGFPWRGHMLLFDVKEDRPRPISAFRGCGAKPLAEDKYIKITEEYMQAKTFEREEQMNRRIYG